MYGGGVCALLIIDVLLMPFGLNFVHFMSKGMEHHLMMFSFSVVLLLPLLVQERDTGTNNLVRGLNTICELLLPLCFVMLTYSNIVYANQVYLKKSLEGKASIAVMTRVLDRIEQTDGYEVGKTPIVFIGEASDTKVAIDRQGFRYDATGLWHKLATADTKNYLEYVFGYPIVTGNADLLKRSDIESMGTFPDGDSVRLVGDQIVVKFR